MTPDIAMRRAIELSTKGFPAPNPHVGCVIVKDGVVVGEGFHDHAGAPHAEVVALTAAGANPKGADVFVTMEPCNHTGRTPPCSQALITAGVSSVTYAVPDPNPEATGGAETLKQAGIRVQSGVCAAEAEAANRMWLTAVRRGWPFILAKAAASIDGKAALPTGESQWITSEPARKRAHELRADCGAVLVGRRTVLADEPLLTARIPDVVNQPVRIILDRGGQLDENHRVFDSSARTIRVVGPGAKHRGLVCPMDGQGFNLAALLKLLYEEGITSLMVEGGPSTLGGFIAAGLVDRLHLFLAPKLLGAGINWVTGLSVQTLADAPAFKMLQVTPHEPDLECVYEPIR